MSPLRLRRSELATPASSGRMIQSAARGEADLVFLDLEDAVAPAQKDSARSNAIEALKGLDWGTKTRAVRINDVSTQWAHQDVIDVVLEAGDALDVLIVPKVRGPRDVWWVETLLDQLEARARRERPVALEVLIEEAEGLATVEALARSSQRLETLIVGFGDLSASLGMKVGAVTGDSTYPGDVWHYARARVLTAARAAGIEAIDGPFPNFRDPDGYREECRRAGALGFTGKWAIHPSQLPIANEVFTPTAEEVEGARRVIEAYRAAEESGAGAAGMAGSLIDAAALRIMDAVIQKAELIERTSC
jgi:citrate lyase subunit beta/citryl-CoA lyase